MNVALTSFVISGSGILGMLLVKYYHIRSGKEVFMKGMRTKTDHFIKRRISGAKRGVNNFNHFSLSLLYKVVVVRLAILFYRIAKAFRSISIRFLDMAKQHSSKRNSGSVSFFLRHISDSKKSNATSKSDVE